MDSGLRVVGRLGFRVEGRNVPKVRSPVFTMGSTSLGI